MRGTIIGKIVYRKNGTPYGWERFEETRSQNLYSISIEQAISGKERVDFHHTFTHDGRWTSFKLRARSKLGTSYRVSATKKKSTSSIGRDIIRAKQWGDGLGEIRQMVQVPRHTALITHPLSIDGRLFNSKTKAWHYEPCYYLSNQGPLGNIGILMRNRVRFVKEVELPEFKGLKLEHHQIQCDLRWPSDEPICDFYIHPDLRLVFLARIRIGGKSKRDVSMLEYKLEKLNRPYC